MEQEVQENTEPNQTQGVMAMIISELFAGVKAYVTTSVDEYTEMKVRMITRKVLFGILGMTGMIFMLVGGVHFINEFLGKSASDAWGYVIVGGLTAFIGWLVFGREEI